MPQRNLLILFAATALSYACYVRGEQDPYARYIACSLATIEEDSLEQVASQDLFEGAMRGMIEVLHDRGDQHSQFIAAQDAGPFLAEVTYQFGGIGVRIRRMGDPPQLTIVGPPEPGTPASREDVRPGDQILAIDGVPIAGLPLDDALRRMRGKPNEPIELTILHTGDSQTVSIRLIREIITIDSVLGDRRAADGAWLFLLEDDPRIAILRVTTFGNKTVAELHRVLAPLVDEGVQAVVLDLRDNAGGALEAAIGICDLFLEAGLPIVETRGPDQQVLEQFITTGRGKYQDLKMALLVNQNSASASEIVAACLQDHGRAVIIGQRSYGKGTVQQLIPVESGKSLLKLTSASYWRPSGKNIHRNIDATDDDPWGAMPDEGYEVRLTEEQTIAYRKYRSQRDWLGEGPPPDFMEEKDKPDQSSFVDRPLQKGIEYLKTRLDE